MEKRKQVVMATVEGVSVNATCRMTGVAEMTVLKLLKDLGEAVDATTIGASATSRYAAPSVMESGLWWVRRKRTPPLLNGRKARAMRGHRWRSTPIPSYVPLISWPGVTAMLLGISCRM